MALYITAAGEAELDVLRDAVTEARLTSDRHAAETAAIARYERFLDTLGKIKNGVLAPSGESCLFLGLLDAGVQMTIDVSVPEGPVVVQWCRL